MDTFTIVAMWTAFALMVGTVIGIIAFLVAYRPLLPHKHPRTGAHMIWWAWAILALYVLELLNAISPFPPRVEWVVDLFILTFIFVVVWQRYALLRWANRMAMEGRDGFSREAA